MLPRDAADLAEIISGAAATGQKLELTGGGTRTGFGAPREAVNVSLKQLAGVVDYDPAELVLTVRPGTLLSEVQALVAGEGQMLAFEPWGDPGSTIGGAVVAGVSGSRRITAGAARDHLLGFAAVSGRGEAFVGGGKVVKNVTGYDLPKLMAGSWGRIAALTELTLKVLPAPRETVTLAAHGLDAASAHSAMACALGSHADVSAAAHLQRGITLLRVAGFAPSVAARCHILPELLSGHCPLRRLDPADADGLWREAMTGESLPGAALWRVHLPAVRASELITGAERLGAHWALDWGGARVWIALDDQTDDIRTLARSLGGEATLVRADPAMRAQIPALPPRAAGVMKLEQRVRRAFDPMGVFATGRFAEDRDADAIPA